MTAPALTAPPFRSGISNAVLWALIVAAIPIWIAVFVVAPADLFFVAMTFGTGGLGAAAIAVAPAAMAEHLRFRPMDVVWGVVSAAGLYAFFLVGQVLATWMFSFAEGEIGSVYGLKEGMNPWVVGTLMVLFIGPGEELFWRGLLHRELAARLGPWAGYGLAVAAYALIHLVTGNFMLILAAGSAGLVWGWLFHKTGRLWPGIISHVLWDVTIFLVWPLA